MPERCKEYLTSLVALFHTVSGYIIVTRHRRPQLPRKGNQFVKIVQNKVQVFFSSRALFNDLFC